LVYRNVQCSFLHLRRDIMKPRSYDRQRHACAAAKPLQIVVRRIDELKPDSANPRSHSKKQIRQIADSITTFGFLCPVLVDADLNLITGHGRLRAGRQLGMTEVPTVRVDHLTPDQIRAFRIADNRLTENATWDDRLLAEQLRDLSLAGLDFDIEVTGFEMAEIDLRITALDGTPEQGNDPADVVPEVLPGTVSKFGDMWFLNRHRVLCADARDGAAFAALMGEEHAAIIFTDPPCKVPIEGCASDLGAIHHRPFPMVSGEMDAPEFTAFLGQAFRNLAAFSADGSIHYICMDWRHIEELLAASHTAYSELKNLCVWVKDNRGKSSLYRSQHELVFVFKHGRNEDRKNIQCGQFGRNRSNVWHYAEAKSFVRSGADGNLLALHQTVKPVTMVADAILDCSGRGEIVLDAFLGSGTAVIAAERTGRRCYGLELDPRYVDTTVRRWQALTKGSARHAASGRCFDDLAREAEAANAP
jgi:DNA modification methylase